MVGAVSSSLFRHTREREESRYEAQPLKCCSLFVALYPVVTAAVWIAGGVLFRLYDEHDGGGRRRAAGRA